MIHPWLSGDGIVQWTTSFPSAWQFIGFFMVIFLAALAGVPEEYYEAARSTAPNAWRQLNDITLPGIKPVYISAMILRCNERSGPTFIPSL